MRAALLLGREHPRLGTTDTVAEGPAAIALSAGGAAKSYAHTDPNEDGALFALGPGGVLLAVADGHAGHDASEAALQHVRDHLAPVWTGEAELRAEGWGDRALEALAGINDAILARTAGGAKQAARTTLSLAVARPHQDHLLIASIGDSHIFHVDPEGVDDLAAEGRPCPPRFFLGRDPKTGRDLAERAAVGELPIGKTRAIVLATDGLSEIEIGVEDPETAVAEAVERAAAAAPDLRALETARDVVETALAAHRRNPSGDNVAAAVLWLDLSAQ